MNIRIKYLINTINVYFKYFIIMNLFTSYKFFFINNKFYFTFIIFKLFIIYLLRIRNLFDSFIIIIIISLK